MRKSLLYISLLLTELCFGAISRDDACNIVQSQLRSEGVDIWVYPNPLSATDTIPLLLDNVSNPFDSAWVFFVDTLALQHTPRSFVYYFVDMSDSLVSTFSSVNCPKALYSNWIPFQLYKIDSDTTRTLPMFCVNPPIQINNENYASSVARVNGRNLYDPSEHNYAVILNLPDYSGYFEDSWNDCALMYNTLIHNEYPLEHIYVAMSDGTSSENDLRLSNGSFISSPLDLDGNGLPDIQYSASDTGLAQLYDDLSQVMLPQDYLFVYIIGANSILTDLRAQCPYSNVPLYNSIDERMALENLANYVYNLPGYTKIVFNQISAGECFEDWYRDFYYQDRHSNYILIDCHNSHYHSETYTGHPYTRRWCETMMSQHGDPNFIGADVNNDGVITYNEVDDYTHGDMVAAPWCLPVILVMNNTKIDSSCVRDPYSDLFIQDNTGDWGEEPNNTTPYSHLSPDIWIEENGVRVSKMQSGHTYDVCVHVHNRGNIISSGMETLHLHWTKAVIGGPWPSSWTEGAVYDCNGTLVMRGGEITPQEGTIIDPIAAGESEIVRVPWEVPSSQQYSVCSQFGDDDLELWHYCLMARIFEGTNQPGEDYIAGSIHELVLNSNSVASRNVTILENQNSQTLTSVVALSVPQMGTYNIRGSIYTSEVYQNALHTRSPHLLFDDNLFNNWSGGGTGFVLDDHTIIITSNEFLLEAVTLDPDNLYLLKFDLDFLQEQHYDFYCDMVLETSYGEVVGGERFVYSDMNGVPPVAPVSSRQLKSNLHEESYPNDAIKSVMVYNQLGQLVMTSTTEDDINTLGSGIYHIYIQTLNGNVQHKQIIK